MMEEYLQLEEGFRFRPKDVELLAYFLRFLAKQELHDNGFIVTHDVYKQEPWETYVHGRSCGSGHDHGDTSNYRYFITPLTKIRETGNNISRSVGEKGGTWKQQDKGKPVLMKHKNKLKKIGLMKSLVYANKKYNQEDVNWHMKEFVLCDAILKRYSNSERKNHVICAIRKKPGKEETSSSSSKVGRNPALPTREIAQENVESEQPMMQLEYETDAAHQSNSAVPFISTGLGNQNMVNTPYCNNFVECDNEPYKVQTQEASKEKDMMGLMFSQVQESNVMSEINVPKMDSLLEENQTQKHQPMPQEGVLNCKDFVAYVESEAQPICIVEPEIDLGYSAMGNNPEVQYEVPEFTTLTTMPPLVTWSQLLLYDDQYLPLLPESRGTWDCLFDEELSPSKSELPEVTTTTMPQSLGSWGQLNDLQLPESTTMVNSNEPGAKGEYCDTTPCFSLSATDHNDTALQYFAGLPAATVEVLDEVYKYKQLEAGDEEHVLSDAEEESSSLLNISDFVEDLLDNVSPDELAAISKEDILLDQQSWLSKMHLQEMMQ